MNWILLRGLTREQGHWGDFRHQLGLRFPDHRFHCIDLPGTGIRFRDSSPSTIAGIRQCVQDYAAHIPGPVGLLGLSMGGMVALDWAQADPERVGRLVLINTSSGFSPPWRRMRPAALCKAIPLLWRNDLASRERRILRLTSNQPVSDALAQHWFTIQCQRPVTLTTAASQMRAATRFRPAVGAPPAQSMLLASAGDRIVHWHCSRELARRWRWPLRVHPDAGHDLVLDAPHWVIQQLDDVVLAGAEA